MGDEAHDRGGDGVTTGVSRGASNSAAQDVDPDDMRALLEQAEAEAAEAEAAAEAARARVAELRSGSPDTPAVDLPPEKTSRFRIRLRRPRRAAIAKSIAALVIAASLAGSGYILWQHHGASARSQRAAAFAAAAGDGITAMTSLDYRHPKEDVQRIIDHLTGSFRDEYEVRADDFIKVVETSKVVARGTVTATGVQPLTDDNEAVVLVAATQEITNAAGNKQPRLYRFRVTVAHEGDQLKMSRVDLVP